MKSPIHLKTKYISLLFCLFMLVSVAAAGVSTMSYDETGIYSGTSTEALHEEGTYKGVFIAASQNPYDYLSVPTWFTRIDDLYYIVDCYHDQVLYSGSTDIPISDWQVMTKDISKGHTIASDGRYYLCDDTENNRVLVFTREDGGFCLQQTFEDIGIRPHFIRYTDEGDFLCLSSMTGEIYVFRQDEEDGESIIHLEEIKKIDSLDGVYVRSFTIIDDDIYFVSGNENSEITIADRKSLEIKERIPVPPRLSGMIQIELIDGRYYITVSTDLSGDQSAATIIRTDDLHGLVAGDYEDIYHRFEAGGTPYSISLVDGAWYLTEHRVPGRSLWSFEVQDSEIENVLSIY